MAEVTIPVSLRNGTSLKVIDALTGTGLAGTKRFILPQEDQLHLSNVTFQHIPTGTFTALSFDLEVSLDGGVTFGKLATFDAFANPAARNDIGMTGIYRLNCTVFTGGTSVDVFAAAP